MKQRPDNAGGFTCKKCALGAVPDGQFAGCADVHQGIAAPAAHDLFVGSTIPSDRIVALKGGGR